MQIFVCDGHSVYNYISMSSDIFVRDVHSVISMSVDVSMSVDTLFISKSADICVCDGHSVYKY